MSSIHVDIAATEWTSGVPFYGPDAVYDGKDLVQLKVLVDRRKEGGGISWMARFLPPPGKLIKIVASRSRMSTSSTSKAAAAPKPGNPHAAPAAMVSTQRASRTVR